MQHSKVVGGSTAKRVINCPGSVALVQRMPPQVESKYAAEGTMLHNCMDELLADETMNIGAIRAKHGLTEEQVEKLTFCVNALDQIDPKQEMNFNQEVTVEFEGVKALDRERSSSLKSPPGSPSSRSFKAPRPPAPTKPASKE